MTTPKEPVSSTKVDDALLAGIAAAKAGRREQARDLLMQVVEQDEENIQAWLWLSGVMEGAEEQEICLENVLALDPGNRAAQKGLERLRRSGFVSPPARPAAPEARPAPPPPEPDAPEAEADMPHPGEVPQPFLEPEQEPPLSYLEEEAPSPYPGDEAEAYQPQAADDFDNEYLCPYCAALTESNDRRCKKCRKKLWLEIRKREKRSTLLWIAFSLQVMNTLVAVGALVVLAYFADRYAARLNPELGAEGLSLFVYLCGGPLVLFQFVVLLGLYFRWKVVYYLYLVNAGFSLLSAIIGLVAGAGLIVGAFNVAVAVGMFALIFQMEDDFFGDRRRMATRVDRGAKSGPSLFSSGRRYAEQGMWAMAALHFRRAVGYSPGEMDFRLALIVAYVNLKRYDLAEKALAEARRLSPGHPEVERIADQLARFPRPAPAADSAPARPKQSKYRRLKPRT